MLYEGLREKGSLIIVPSSALDTMNLGAMAGLTSLSEKHGGEKPKDVGATGEEAPTGVPASQENRASP